VDRAECLAFPIPCGRRTAGQTLGAVDAQDAVVRYQRQSTCLEHLAVQAFERLAHELTSHAAPQTLVDRAVAARDDERRHVRAAKAPVRQRGADRALHAVGSAA